MAAYCEVKEFRKRGSHFIDVSMRVRVQGMRQEMHRFIETEDLPILLQEASDVIMYAAIEPREFNYKTKQNYCLGVLIWP